MIILFRIVSFNCSCRCCCYCCCSFQSALLFGWLFSQVEHRYPDNVNFDEHYTPMFSCCASSKKEHWFQFRIKPLIWFAANILIISVYTIFFFEPSILLMFFLLFLPSSLNCLHLPLCIYNFFFNIIFFLDVSHQRKCTFKLPSKANELVDIIVNYTFKIECKQSSK